MTKKIIFVLVVLLVSCFIIFVSLNLKDIGEYTETDNGVIITDIENPLETMQKCSDDDDCIYADNSCCPYTDPENIVAINKAYKQYYKDIGETCAENVVCPEIRVEPHGSPECVNNKCQ
ncbi:MAG: hypothetical protein AABX82_06335 [Nanoarchaeota archaeon]